VNTETLSIDSLRGILDETFRFRWTEDCVLEVVGVETPDLLHRLSTNDILTTSHGKTVGSCFLTEKGRMVDYVNILLRDSGAWVLTSPGNATTLSEWIRRFIIMEDIVVHDRSTELSGYSIVGPRAGEEVSRAFGVFLSPWEHAEIIVDDHSVIVSRRGERENDRFDILVPRVHQNRVEALFENLPSLDRSMMELHRIWRGIPGFGNEISEAHNPYEAGLSGFLHSRKGCYIGQEVIARLDTYDKIQRSLTGILLSEKAMRSQSRELFVGEDTIGMCTSNSAFSIAGYFPGLAIIKRNTAEGRSTVTLSKEDASCTAVITQLPFSLEVLDSIATASSGSQR